MQMANICNTFLLQDYELAEVKKKKDNKENINEEQFVIFIITSLY
jgi:hypothetical protein